MRKLPLLALIALAALAMPAGATDYNVTQNSNYLLTIGDSLYLGSLQVKVVDTSTITNAIAVMIFTGGKQQLGFTRIGRGEYLPIPPYTIEFLYFTKVDETDYANVSVYVDPTPTPRATPTPEPTLDGGATPEPTEVPANPTPRPLEDEQGYPLGELTAEQAANAPDCGGATAANAIASLSPSNVVHGDRVNLLLQDAADSNSLTETKVRVLYPSGRTFEVQTDGLGLASFIATEKGHYQVVPGECYQLPDTGFYAYPENVPGLAKQVVPAIVLEFFIDNYFTILVVIVAILLLTVAWFTYDFINENTSLDEALEEAEAWLERTYRDLKLRIQGKQGEK